MGKLTVNEVLSVVENPEQHGKQWKALCPAHNDKNSSLSITEGNDGFAVCHCFANCSSTDIFKAIRSRLGNPPSFSEDNPRKQFKKEISRYDYIDESGKVINTKVRLEDKSFYWTIKGNKTPVPLFNLKGVIENELIFLVEGEKDVLSLQKLGYGVTSDRDGLTPENARKYLSGKDIIIIPDNDKPGREYGEKAFGIVRGIAKSVKMVDLKSVWSEVPPKGDITDYIEKGFSVDRIIEKANSIEEPKENSSVHPHLKTYEPIEGYSLNDKNQIVYVKSEDERIPLCHGSIIITEVIHKNNGDDDSIEFECDGITESLKRLPKVIIPSDEFDSLKWITKNWGCEIVPFGTQSTIQKLVCGIKLTGQSAKQTYKHCHTGYVNDKNGKPISYLYSGGCIGNQGIVCELDDSVRQYRLSGCSSSDNELKESFLASLSLLKAHQESVTFPLLAFIYLVPLAQINKEVNGESGFCLYLRGKTQNGKSTLSALGMSHFGEFTSSTPPTSFESTPRYNEYMSSLLKDSVLWVDDFHPKGTKAERDKQNEQMNKIARASGDRAFRGRLNSNAESGKIYTPRCFYLVTGEDEPQLSQSGLARIFTLEVKTERKDLTKLFEASRNGLLSRAMSDYISYIIGHYDDVKSLFEKRYSYYIGITRKDLGENRLSIQSALLMTSFDCWLGYAVNSKLIDKSSAVKLAEKNASTIIKNAHKNDEEIKSSDPVEKFISTLSTMISNKEVEVRDIKFGSENNELYNNTYIPRIGWFDEEFYFLAPENTYKAVKDKLESIDDSIGATMNGLYRELRDQGLIISDNSNSPSKLKRINGKPKRVLFIKRNFLEIQENNEQ